MIKVLIIEDELIPATDLANNLRKNFLKITGIARNLAQVVEKQNIEKADVALVDIFLQDSNHNGLEIARFLKENYDCSLIFLTAYSDQNTFNTAKNLNPVAFLGKPFKINELVYQIQLAFNNKNQSISNLKKQSKKEIFLPDGRDYLKIKLEDLILVKADKSYIDIYISGFIVPRKVTMNIGHIESELPEELFFRVSKSVIVNLTKIQKFNSDEISLEGVNESVSLPKGKKGELVEKLNVLKTP
jgi:DNA-binding LytR/AlgR family response regulator